MSNGSNILQPEPRPSESLADLAIDVAQPEVADLRKQSVDASQPEATVAVELGLSSESKEVSELNLSTASLSRNGYEKPYSTLRMSTGETRHAALEARLERLKDRPQFVERLKQQTSSRNRAQSKSSIGLFKNPFYKYRGGVFSRIITFFANILKCLEVLFLRRLSRLDMRNNVQKKNVEVILPSTAGENPQAKADALRLKEKKRMAPRSRASR